MFTHPRDGAPFSIVLRDGCQFLISGLFLHCADSNIGTSNDLFVTALIGGLTDIHLSSHISWVSIVSRISTGGFALSGVLCVFIQHEMILINNKGFTVEALKARVKIG